MVTDETRASIARRRLEALTAAYDAQIPRPDGRRSPSHAAEATWRLSTAHLRVAVSVAVAAGILMTWWVLSGRPRTAEPEAVQLTSQAAGAGHDGAGDDGAGHAGTGHANAPSSRVVVDVTGKVKRPGIITLRAGSRVHEAIEKAGGTVDGADTAGINLARVLADGEQIVVGESAPNGQAAGPGSTGGRVSLNSATLEELDALPGIGPVTAQAIIDFRGERGGFRTVEDLLDVSGIGEQTLAELRDRVTP
jgi:competence protein ComEA